jgi:hypothetical protein
MQTTAVLASPEEGFVPYFLNKVVIGNEGGIDLFLYFVKLHLNYEIN